MPDHSHMFVCTSTKLPVLEVMETINVERAIVLLETKKYLKEERGWDNHFGTRGSFVNTVCVDEQLIRCYFQHQEKEHMKQEQERQEYTLLSG